jgi:hypothetical protein
MEVLQVLADVPGHTPPGAVGDIGSEEVTGRNARRIPWIDSHGCRH